MRVLYVVPYAPNLVRVRPYNLVRELARQGVELVLATLWERPEEEADLAALRGAGINVVAYPLPATRKLANILGAAPGRQPLQSAFCWQPDLAAALRRAVFDGQGFDVVHVEHLRGAAYGLDLLRADAGGRRPTPPIVWDAVDCISHLFGQAASGGHSLRTRAMARLELARTRRLEAVLVRRFQRTLVTSSMDRDALLALASGPDASFERGVAGPRDEQGRVVVLPNGVDTTFFQPLPAPPTRSPILVVTGKMSYHANVSMVMHLMGEIMPRIWRERSDAALFIVGKDPPPAVRRLATTTARGPAAPEAAFVPRTVVVTGTVPDIRPYVRSATVALAPLQYGAGIQNKVLEAMACGIPVVATTRAVTALDARPGRDLLVAEDPVLFALDVLALLDDPGRRRSIARSGRSFIEERHGWESMGRELLEVYRGAIAAPHAAGG